MLINNNSKASNSDVRLIFRFLVNSPVKYRDITDHIKKDGGMSILSGSFAKGRFYRFKNSHKINILGHQNMRE